MWLMANRQARLEPLALSASGHERMVNGWAAASGEKGIEFSAGIARFGDIQRSTLHASRLTPHVYCAWSLSQNRSGRSHPAHQNQCDRMRASDPKLGS